ncbi:MAG: hypothetical protein LUI09_03275 [Prevotellaceae bacterium]|nr:hypothetical protein [Prevotellaceae bacterium]
MTQQEFQERVKFEVEPEEFWAIHTVYVASDLDKDDFCKAWRRTNKQRIEAAKATQWKPWREGWKRSYELSELDGHLFMTNRKTLVSLFGSWNTDEMDRQADLIIKEQQRSTTCCDPNSYYSFLADKYGKQLLVRVSETQA